MFRERKLFWSKWKINSIRNSQVLLKQKCSVGDMCVIGGNDTGNIIIGDRT